MIPAWIELEGAHNARDMGGLTTPDGPTRSGVLLRSDALDQLTPGDVERLTEVVGLSHVIDLRSGSERERRGRGLLGGTGIRYSELEIIGVDDMTRRQGERETAVAAGRPTAEIMSDGYVELLALGGQSFSTAFRRILEPGGSPVLVHCAAGKDRTGVMIALLLDVAGVDRADIIADYAATDGRMAPILERFGVGASYEQANRPDDAAARVPAFVFGAQADTMAHFVRHLDTTWGGGAGYLRGHGITDDELAAWRTLFVG
ncbi:MAG: tyrosine-protein phosphatase [Ilumatobacteraceae bacterium]